MRGLKTVVFKGSDSTFIDHRVLKKRLREHFSYYDWDHDIELIYPGRKTDRVVDAQIFLATAVKMTALDALKFHVWKGSQVRRM